MKRCPSCGNVKPVDQFYRLARSKDGRQGYCKACANEKRQAWKRANPERESEWRKNSRPRTPEESYASRLRTHFKMTPEDYDARLADQGGLCPGCQRTPERVGSRFHVDHDHSCCDTRYTCGSCVRGLLCANCNAALGHVRDNPEVMLALIAYLGAPDQCKPIFLKPGES